MSKYNEAKRKWLTATERASINFTAGLRGLPAAVVYDGLRERYVEGTISLEEFTAGVVQLLREGL